MRLLFVLATLTACDAGGRTPPAPTPSSPPIPVVAPGPVVAPAVVAPAPAVAVDASITLDSLVRPILPLEPLRRVRSNPYLDSAISTASHGGTGEPGQVISGVLAVAADPSSVPARFIEACLLAQVGQHALARAVIEEVRVAGCATCGDALLELRNASCGFDDETKRLADGVTPSPLRAAAIAILASLNSGDAASIEAYLDGGSISMQSSCSVCDEERTTESTFTAATFKAFVRAADKRSTDPHSYSGPVFMFCDAQCCEGPTGYLNHSSSFVTEVCFRGGAKAPKLASISAVDG